MYFTPPGMIQALGRGLLEALAVGVPLITSKELGDAAIYAEPDTVIEIVRKLREDPEFYAHQLARGYAFVEREFSYEAHIKAVGTS